jgi:hypothetical protein
VLVSQETNLDGVVNLSEEFNRALEKDKKRLRRPEKSCSAFESHTRNRTSIVRLKENLSTGKWRDISLTAFANCLPRCSDFFRRETTLCGVR